ncbi:hypothetical protein PR048_014945 [Dryococelus australis]|uniref:Uncharacterized protein n=1 Tax=Dryococelus australis TaxID=614101 RepID=A0ABQ9HFL4_9NEOP|nr:hypothetical protein PR048_014945 [Dryococelus australis]
MRFSLTTGSILKLLSPAFIIYFNFKGKTVSESYSLRFYFSNGSAAQYKNREDYIYLCHHEKDFVTLIYHFLCDGVGCTVKQLVTNASLQHTLTNHILTPSEMYDYCGTNIKGITFFQCSRESIEEAKKLVQPLFENFVPVNSFSLQIWQTSQSTDFKIVSIINEGSPVLQKINAYMCCMYHNSWWLGIMNDVAVLELELTTAKDRITSVQK